MSVVHYNPLAKGSVLQQNNVGNQQGDRQIIVLRKQQHILPQPKEIDKDNILITNTAKKKARAGGKEIKTSPPPVAVARRNARERNRVKQVNNGFANLRQHIPNFIAAAFENTSGRGGSKKLSKVETLRMAVEYIRSLEDLLAMSGERVENAENVSDVSYPSPSSSTSPATQSNVTYMYQVLSPPAEDDDLTSNSTPPPSQQFIRINTSNSYQILSASIYENGENLDPLEDQILSEASLMDPSLDFHQDLSYLNAIHATSSLSPEIYSNASLSPNSTDKTEQNCFIPVFNTPPQERLSPSFQVKKEEEELPVISLKTENELPEEHKENIVDVLEWWEEQPENEVR